MRRTILGQQPPPDAYLAVGAPENYYIHGGYTIRQRNVAFDDSTWEDEAQRDVYWFARDVADKYDLKTVLDIGCGSGYKLVTNFYNHETTGIEVDRTYRHCIRAWPNRNWRIVDYSWLPETAPDLVICSDVIEHVLHPDQLMDYISRLHAKYAVLSTPERNLLLTGAHDGPPHNPAHVREWSFPEMSKYARDTFTVKEHFVLGYSQVLLLTAKEF